MKFIFYVPIDSLIATTDCYDTTLLGYEKNTNISYKLFKLFLLQQKCVLHLRSWVIQDEKHVDCRLVESKVTPSRIPLLLLRCHNVKNGKEASEVTEGKSCRMCWGKVNRVKEIRRIEKDGLKITDNSIVWGRKCHE